ncbi:MAG: hypothetical protein WCL41_01750 [Betaproteobacteria bacterium]
MAEAEKNTDDTAVLEAPVDEVEATDAVESGENTSEGGDEPILDVDATADRLTEIANQSLDSNEVARQIEELTSVVLDSAEVSTRSASIAADVSSAMRMVVAKIEETNRRNVLHSRVMLGAICVSLLVAMGFFFGITLKMTKSIKELDVMTYAMSKRMIEIDGSISAIGKTNSDFSEITDKQEELNTTQKNVANRLDEIGRVMSLMPNLVADQNNKLIDAKLLAMNKSLASMEAKIAANMDADKLKQQPVQLVLAEIQKMRTEMNQNLQARDKLQASAYEQAVKSASNAAAMAQKAADNAVAAEKAAAAERLTSQKAAAERAAAMRFAPPEKPPERTQADKAAADKAAAERAAAKASAERAAALAAERAGAAERAAEKARAAAQAAATPPPAPTPVVRERPIQFPRPAD